MDDWSKKAGYLRQHSALVDALKKVEHTSRFTPTAADSCLRASIAAESQRAALLSMAQAAEIYTGSRHSTAYSDLATIDRFGMTGEILRAQEVYHRQIPMYSVAAIETAKTMAELAQESMLHSALAPYRTSVGMFTDKLLHLQTPDTLASSAYLDAFMQASTMSDIFEGSIRVDRELREATRQFSLEVVPTFGSLSDYRHFLDAAGLRLRHWPHVRLLKIGEKRRRFRAMLDNNSPPTHVRNGKTLVQRYELTLREILDDVMESEYGEDWALIRLPLCDCKDLLGKWKKRGGNVLAHADYAHYERIMSNSEHFDTVFKAGFDDPATLAELIKKAGNLRAALLHFHQFTQEDLRDLRLVWRTIEKGLLALTADYDIDSWN